MTTRISGEALRAAQVYSQQNINQSQRRNAEQSSSKGLPEDKVDLSPQARELATALRIFRETDVQPSEERNTKLAELARKVQMGLYQPSAQSVAARLGPALQALDSDLAERK